LISHPKRLINQFKRFENSQSQKNNVSQNNDHLL
jgi:hypothetical protein